jgi:hypothetical protein
MPFVGDAGRSLLPLTRACVELIVSVRPRVVESSSVVEALSDTDGVDRGNSELVFPRSEIDVVAENLLFEVALSFVEPDFEGTSEVTLTAPGLVLRAPVRAAPGDIPVSPRLPVATMSSLAGCSSLLFLKAALPTPRSAVCLNHPGSLAPSEAAI